MDASVQQAAGMQSFFFSPSKVVFYRYYAIYELSLRAAVIKVIPFESENSSASTTIIGFYDHIADHYREYLVGRGIKFDTLKSITDKANRKVKNLLRDEVRKHQRFNCLTDSQLFTMIRSKFYYMVDK
ncbi:hypothetical protein G6F16_013599 [Rhizopus arrhizus]|uniref:Uncharacterized protein n=1 Tax=Rhizopus oryzae TaxID=64495 RepID=A0A9P7BKI2_RHIOR|nr:hypothetical protein G6F19_013592 [Rhizopus arrhizus]KAG0810308.1 hypothetical protein G6F18_013616 [Rhizopus arrhizus]KAG0846018.1 hypothetical protein G6F17_013449 [Rhizopus arrhizus]KAG0856022.1 hypothetical protein G6F16_013599 [Rhizopus arrhizus]KAG0861965.1 hypothetical protein G6F15_013638 [Rhizopus arrhizus]